MLALKKKLKKINKAKKFLYFFTTCLYLVALVYFIFGILHLSGIETFLRIIIIILLIIWFLVYFVFGLIAMLTKRTKLFLLMSFITIILCPVCFVSSYYINRVYGSLKTMNRDTITYTSNLIALKDTEFNKNSIIGMIETESDIEGNELAKKLIQKNNLTNNVKNYEDYHTMIQDLYNGKIDACFVSGNYAITFANETFEETDGDTIEVPLADRVKVLYKYSEDRENADNATLSTPKTKKVTEPFTVLVMGVDSEDDGLKANQAFNGDTLMMITFNPNTLTATMFSVPRDLYVPIACNNNRYAKINSSAAYGSTCVINTIQKLTGIDIDYYLKMNFKGVVDLVEALGGVTVDVEEPDFRFNAGVDCGGKVCEQDSLRRFGKNMIYIDPGIQTLNGEQALAYARCRHLYAMSDIARNQHQQDLITAMAQKLREVRELSDFERILDAVSNNIETNMTPEQILSFYNIGKDMLLNSNSNSLSIKKTYLSYYNLTVWRGYNASALGYYQPSLDAITKLMKVNLGLEEEKPVKTFSISYDEDYTTPLVGMGITGGTKLEVLPNFIGFDKDYVDNWCRERSLNCTFTSEKSNLEKGSIITQSAHENELLKSLSSVKFTYSDGSSYDGSDNDNDDDKDNDDKNNDELKMPNFTGYAKSYVSKWCTTHKLNCTYEIKDSNVEKDEIIGQSVKTGTILKEKDSIVFTVSNGKLKEEKPNQGGSSGSNSGSNNKPDEIPGGPTVPEKPDTDESDKPNDNKEEDTPPDENDNEE